MNFDKFDYLTKENKGDCFVLYGWGIYPAHSVLAGQQSKQYLHSFDTAVELEAFMEENGLEGNWSSPLVEREISLNHLPDGEDW